MKRITNITLIMAIMASFFTAFTPVYSEDSTVYRVEENQFYSAADKSVVYTLTQGKFYGRVKITNISDSDISAVMVAALFKDGSLLDIAVQNAEFAPGTYVYLSNMYRPFTIPAEPEGYEIKTYVLNNMTDLDPLCQCGSISAYTTPPVSSPTPIPSPDPTPIPSPIPSPDPSPTPSPEQTSATLFDNFSSLKSVITQSISNYTQSTGALYSESNWLYTRIDRTPYGYTKYEGNGGNVIEGYWDGSGVPQTYIGYSGQYANQTLRVAFSAQKNAYDKAYKAIYNTSTVTYGDWDVLRQYYFGSNLHIYAGPNASSLTEVPISCWEGDNKSFDPQSPEWITDKRDTNESEITFIAAKTVALPENTGYVKIVINNIFYWPFRLLSVKVNSAEHIDDIDTVPSTPAPTPEPKYDGDLTWINSSYYPSGKISVAKPSYTSEINGDTFIYLCAPGFSNLNVKCWKQSDSEYGSDSLVTNVALDSRGRGAFKFPASMYPHGPNVIRIDGTNSSGKADECNLQLYNNLGVSWQEGASSAPIPPAVTDNNLKLCYYDDFTDPLSITYNGRNAKYASHKPGYQDFSGIAFENFEIADTSKPNPKNPFKQVDTYLRIRADENIDSTGLISSANHSYGGMLTSSPCYFECKFVAQNATGTWPAFWLLTEKDSTGRSEELDVIEAYGFDKSSPNYDAWGSLGYSATFHKWYNPNTGQGSGTINMTAIGGGGSWWTNFHTYGCYIGPEDTIYYMDNIEVYRHPTGDVSKSKRLYFLINLAVGGISGWPMDLSRYNGLADMYVDWVKVYNVAGEY